MAGYRRLAGLLTDFIHIAINLLPCWFKKLTKRYKKEQPALQKTEVLHAKIKTVLPIVILVFIDLQLLQILKPIEKKTAIF